MQDDAPAAPATVAYLATPAGEVIASESALASLRRGQLWATLSTVLLFVGGGLAALLGVYASLLFIFNPEARNGANLVVAATGLVFGTLALVAAVLLFRYVRAVRRTLLLRRTEDLEDVAAALGRVWFWLAGSLIVTLGWPFAVTAFAAWIGVWP